MLVNFLQRHNWRISYLAEGEASLGDDRILARYSSVLHTWTQQVAGVKSAVNHDETAWLLTLADYCGESDSEYSWDFIEKLGLDSAIGDPVWTDEIKRFWDRVLPVGLSVANGYQYYGLDADSGFITGSSLDISEYDILGHGIERLADSLVRG